MKKIAKTNAARLLDAASIEYELKPYEVDETDLGAQHVADQLGENIEQVFKTLVLQGDKTGLGYAGVIFSFFFWGIVLGPVLGLLLAIPLSAFCVVLWRALKSKYIRPVV